MALFSLFVIRISRRTSFTLKFEDIIMRFFVRAGITRFTGFVVMFIILALFHYAFLHYLIEKLLLWASLTNF